MSSRTIITCDIEGCNKDATHKKKTISVRFTTEQTEGRAVPPYLSGETLDMCDEHYQQYIDLLPIVGTGAQGFNHFSFKDTK